MKLFRNHPDFIRIAHISDLHFSKTSFNPVQFLSKRWIGNMNLLLFRREMTKKDHLVKLCKLLDQEKVDLFIVSGDLSCTSLKDEFTMAQQFLDSIDSGKTSFLVLPGNHDHYTKKAFQDKRFYQFFTNPTSCVFPEYSLRKDRIEVHALNDQWRIITLDTTLATSLLSSQGLFSKELEDKLSQVLASIPSDLSVMIVNHYPFFQNERAKNLLLRGNKLQELIQKHPHVKMYLHGHTHRECIADLRVSNLPIVLDSGSTGSFDRASFHMMDLYKNKCDLKTYQWKENWTLSKETSLNLKTSDLDQ